jgi:alcohol dehydrogenase class IV
MEFDFSTSSRILFGTGCATEIGKLALEFGPKGVVIHDSRMDPGEILHSLDAAGLKMATISVTGEPTIESVQEGIGMVKTGCFDFLIALGGGSTIDTSKTISAMATNPGDLLDYLEVVGKGQPLQNMALPLIAMPTTAGTGSEVTRNAVLKVPESHVKVSLRGSKIIPRVALVDPALTYALSPAATASTGMDALTQVIEPFLSRKANRLTDMFCREGIARAARSLRLAYQNGHNAQARTDMSWTSLLGGLSLANAGLGAVHGFAGVIGGMYPAPHGEICARLLPEVMEQNYRVCQQDKSFTALLEKFMIVATLLTGKSKTSVDEGIDWVRDLCESFSIRRLKELGIPEGDFGEIIEKSKLSSSMKGNPVDLPDATLLKILQQSF